MSNIQTMQPNLWHSPAFTRSGALNALIEIPAGTTRKFEYDRVEGRLKQDLRNGQPRRVDFLPYPVNYGFIPSTHMDKEGGGDGDPLDVLVLAEPLPQGHLLEVRPIALLLMEDLGELDHKVLATPIDPALQIVREMDWVVFQRDYAAILSILELFFGNYDGPGVTHVHGWADGQAAIEEVKKWSVGR